MACVGPVADDGEGHRQQHRPEEQAQPEPPDVGEGERGGEHRHGGGQRPGAQGGGAIKDANGNLTKAGDKDAVKSYEVDSLFSSIFKNHNASGFAHFVSNDGTLGGGRSDHALQDLNQQLGRLAMLGFFTLMSSLSATSIKPWGSAA